MRRVWAGVGIALAFAILGFVALVGILESQVKSIVIPSALAQTSCVVMNEPALLALFADNVGNSSITPAAIRNVICTIYSVVNPAGVTSVTDISPMLCGKDATSTINTAIAAMSTGGTIRLPSCVVNIDGEVIFTDNFRFTGTGPVGYKQQSDVPLAVWPPTGGSAINCTSTTVPACIMDNGQGFEFDHINAGNPQIIPPPSCPASGPCNNWAPNIFPPIIGTDPVNREGWQGFYLHDATCTGCTTFADLEGTPDYHTYSGSQIKLQHLWCNACLGAGFKLHLIDNSSEFDHIDFVPSWYFNYPPLGYYMRQNSVGFDIQYLAAPQFHDVNFFSDTSMRIHNGTVTNNFGTLTFALSAAQMTNFMFNEVCQGITMPDGSQTIATLKLTQVDVWGDQSGFRCAAGKPFFDMPTNDVNISMSQVNVYDVDQFIRAGCGAPGVGSCPSNAPGGAAIVRLSDLDISQYSQWTNGQSFIAAPAGTALSFGNTDKRAIRPANASAGLLIGPGLDGTIATEELYCIGGGTNPSEGAVCMQSSLGPPGAGAIDFFAKDHTFLGYVTADTTGISVQGIPGPVVLRPFNNATRMTFGFSGGVGQINTGTLPSAPPSGTGTAYICVDNAGNLYVKGSCP